MTPNHSSGSSRIRAGRLAAGLGLAVALTISSWSHSEVVRAQDQAAPAAEQAVADRYVVTVSGMT